MAVTEVKPSEKKMNRTLKRGLSILVILAILGALALPKLLPEGESTAGPGGPGPARDTLLVQGHVIAPTSLVERIVTTGTLQANESVDLVSEASGKLTEILFREGSFVEQGQLLVKINDADLRAQRERALHRLRLAEKREERQRQILDKGGISQEEYDLALSEVNVLRAEIQLIDAQIAKTEIRAPFSGVIGLRYVSEGSYISPQTRIASLQSLNPLKVNFTLPEKYAGQVKAGNTFTFRVAGRDQVYRGQVYAIEPAIAQNTRTLQLRAVTQNPDGTLLPGAFANIEFVLSETPDALTVPTIAVVPEMASKKVFVYRDGRAMPQQVETGLRTESDVQIVHGLAPGDTVLTSGIQLIRPGLPVKVSLN